MAKLQAHVHVHTGAGQTHVFGPDDDVPEWAQALITNPDAWEGGVLPASRLTEPEPTPTPVKKAPAKRAAPRRKAVGNGAAGTE